MKRLIGIILGVLLILPVFPVSAVEKDAGLNETQIAEILRALEILQGDENGNLKLDTGVTRAQFVKMAVAASTYKDDANVKLSVSQFPDVSATHWAAGYIRVGVSSGWIKGYLDGTFRPDGNVKLEEAVTIVLKLLGYTDADFVGSYPDGQLAKYKSLKLYNGVSATQGQELTRRDCMNLIYNVLCTATKTGTPYGKTLGYTADSDGNLDYNALIESKKDGPFVVTDENWQSAIGMTDATYYKDGKEISASDIKRYDVLYYSKEFSKVWVCDEKTAGVIDSLSPDKSNPTSVTVSGKTYSIAKRSAYAGALSGGNFAVEDAVILLLGENGEAVEAYAAKTPFVAETRAEIGNDIVLYKNNTYAADAELSDSSLVFYSAESALALTYDKNVSGLVSALLPNKQNPTSIKIGSSEYTLSPTVKELFKNQAVYGEDSFITAYLGANGQIEFVQDADIFDTDIYEDNGISYETLLLQTLKGPEIAIGDTWKQKIDFDLDKATYYLNGKQVESTVIKNYDVLYYSNAFKTVWVYSDRVTGVLEKINPSTVAPTSVTVAGSEYSIETSAAAIQFAGKGSFAVGDTVTLLLGKAGGVVAAEEAEAVSTVVLGISTDVSQKEYTLNNKTYSDYYVTVSSFDGGVYSVRTDNKNFDVGVTVMITLNNGVQTVKPYSGKYSNVSEVVSAIRNDRIAADAVLVDCYKKNFATTYVSRLKEIEITAKNVLYYSMNADGELSYLVLDDATGDLHSYGVVLGKNGNYTFKTSAKNNSLSSYSVPTLGAVAVKYNGSDAESMKSLIELSATDLSENAVWVGGKSYKLWDYAEYFVMTQKSFTVAGDSGDAVSDVIIESSYDNVQRLIDEENYTLRAFRDESGMVRVVIAQKKY